MRLQMNFLIITWNKTCTLGRAWSLLWFMMTALVHASDSSCVSLEFSFLRVLGNAPVDSWNVEPLTELHAFCEGSSPCIWPENPAPKWRMSSMQIFTVKDIKSTLRDSEGDFLPGWNLKDVFYASKYPNSLPSWGSQWIPQLTSQALHRSYHKLKKWKYVEAFKYNKSDTCTFLAFNNPLWLNRLHWRWPVQDIFLT